MNNEPKSSLKDLECRIAKAKDLIAGAAIKGDWKKAETITAATKDLDSLYRETIQLIKKARKTMAHFDTLTKNHIKSKSTKLKVVVRWNLTGNQRADDCIMENKAADTLRCFIELLVQTYGDRSLKLISTIPNGASGLVSQNPNGDFVNPASGDIYAYQHIGDTSWTVKTHSSTKQKAEQITQIWNLLDMPANAIQVDSIPK